MYSVFCCLQQVSRRNWQQMSVSNCLLFIQYLSSIYPIFIPEFIQYCVLQGVSSWKWQQMSVSNCPTISALLPACPVLLLTPLITMIGAKEATFFFFFFFFFGGGGVKTNNAIWDEWSYISVAIFNSLHFMTRQLFVVIMVIIRVIMAITCDLLWNWFTNLASFQTFFIL